MPTLDWIGKKAVVNHHREVPYHLLKCDRELSVGDPGSGNLLVQGDNLLALKALLPYYAGKVKCIYIDPPYNTGNENWVYNDAVNSPEIRKWLGSTVGREAEDLSRHDKWLCMMYPRLAMLRSFLTEDGIIFISIDDHSLQNLCALMDELFGRRSRLGILVWKSRHFTDTRPQSGISEDHEYILVYGKTAEQRIRGKDKDFTKYKNPDNDPRGPWTSCSLLGKATKEQRPNLHYDFADPVTGQTFPCPKRTGWICAKETMLGYAQDKRLLYPKKPGGRLRQKVFKHELKSDVMGFPSVITDHSTSDGTEALRSVLGDQIFSFPKPPRLICDLVLQATEPTDIVLDSFAGSATTGEAVLYANQTDGGSRRFLLVEMDETVCSGIARPRLSTVICGRRPDGSAWQRDETELLAEEKLTITAIKKGAEVNARFDELRDDNRDEFDELKKVIEDGYLRLYGIRRGVEAGLGGGLRYCRLGPTVFEETGAIRSGVTFGELAAHIYFAETGEPLPKRSNGKTPLLGIHNGKSIYLLFNGILGDRSTSGGNVLTNSVLAALPAYNGPRIIYGEGSRLGKARLKREGVVFKQIPYGIKVS